MKNKPLKLIFRWFLKIKQINKMGMIKLTETGLKNFIKKTINESAGVPSGITATANKMFDKITEHLASNLNFNAETNKKKERIFTINGDFNVSDFKFGSILIEIEVVRSYKYDNYLTFSTAISDVQVDKTNDFRIKQIEYKPDNNTIVLIFNTNTSFLITYSNILKLLNANRGYFITILTHELKHQFDGIKKPLNPVLKKANYASYSENMGNPIESIEYLITAMYYTHDFENMVRNSELYSKLEDAKTTKSEFKTFLENSEMYNNLMGYRDLSISDIIYDIKINHMDDVDKKLKDEPNFEYMNKDQKIKRIFELLYIGIRDSKLGYLKTRLSDSLNGIRQLMDKNKDFYDAEKKKIDETDVMAYFKERILEINKNAAITLKNLSRLYSLLKEGSIGRERITPNGTFKAKLKYK